MCSHTHTLRSEHHGCACAHSLRSEHHGCAHAHALKSERLECLTHTHWDQSIMGVLTHMHWDQNVMDVLTHTHWDHSVMGVLTHTHWDQSIISALTHMHWDQSITGVMLRAEPGPTWFCSPPQTQLTQSLRRHLSNYNGKGSYRRGERASVLTMFLIDRHSEPCLTFFLSWISLYLKGKSTQGIGYNSVHLFDSIYGSGFLFFYL